MRQDGRQTLDRLIRREGRCARLHASVVLRIIALRAFFLVTSIKSRDARLSRLRRGSAG